jgi:hypothetical protein
MSSTFEKLRQWVDDLLRVVGLWSLLGVTVTTLAVAVGAGLTAYLKGAPREWLFLFAGAAIATGLVLGVTALLWLVQRARVRSQLRGLSAGSKSKGFLDHKIEQAVANRQLTRLLLRLTALNADFGRVIGSSTTWIKRISGLPEAQRDPLLRWLTNRTAQKVSRGTVKFVAAVSQLEDTANTLIGSQDAFLRYALRQKQDRTGLIQLREAVVGFKSGMSTATSAQEQFIQILTTGDLPTGEMIDATYQLSVVVGRSVTVTKRLDEHATNTIAMIDAKLAET